MRNIFRVLMFNSFWRINITSCVRPSSADNFAESKYNSVFIESRIVLLPASSPGEVYWIYQ